MDLLPAVLQVSDSLITVTEWSSGSLGDQNVTASVVAIACAGNLQTTAAVGLNETTCAGQIVENNATFVSSILELQPSHQNVTLFLPPAARLCLSSDGVLHQTRTSATNTTNMWVCSWVQPVLLHPPQLSHMVACCNVANDSSANNSVNAGRLLGMQPSSAPHLC
jgi:hypothetical protein